MSAEQEARTAEILAKCEQLLADLLAAQEQIVLLLGVLQQAAADEAARKQAGKAIPAREDAAC